MHQSCALLHTDSLHLNLKLCFQRKFDGQRSSKMSGCDGNLCLCKIIVISGFAQLLLPRFYTCIVFSFDDSLAFSHPCCPAAYPYTANKLGSVMPKGWFMHMTCSGIRGVSSIKASCRFSPLLHILSLSCSNESESPAKKRKPNRLGQFSPF